MQRRAYRGPEDVELLQRFTAEATAATDGCGYVHPGDIPHRLFNGNKWFDPAEVLTIWEAESSVAAWALVSPRYKGYDAQVRPDLRGGDLERRVLEYCDGRTIELMARHGIESDRLVGEAFRCDRVRAELLGGGGPPRCRVSGSRVDAGALSPCDGVAGLRPGQGAGRRDQ
jgi:mycothiol synthase